MRKCLICAGMIAAGGVEALSHNVFGMHLGLEGIIHYAFGYLGSND